MIRDNGKAQQKHSKEKYVVVMRHGERADLAGQEVLLNKSDPELTEEGKNQAYNAGRRLRELLEEMYIDESVFSQKKIAVISSPFERTLITAKYAKNGMNLNVPLYIEDGLSEFISKNWFFDHPSEFLCLYHHYYYSDKEMDPRHRMKKPELLLNELMNEVVLNKSLGKLPEFPESTNQCISRFNITLELLIYSYLVKNDFDIIILVTHFFGLHTLCAKMEIPMDYFDIEYCSTFLFKYEHLKGNFTFEKNFYPVSGTEPEQDEDNY